jgi:hypothetical protein
MALARYRGVAQDGAGNVIPNATVEVRRDQAGRPVVPLFSDRNGTVPLGNPITTNERGQFAFHAPGGVYYIRVFTGPSQSPFQVFEDRYVAIGTAAERDVEELASSLNSGMGIFSTFENLELFTPEADNVGARVIADPDATLNGDYIYVTDTWVKQRGLPDTLARLDILDGSTPDTIDAEVVAGVDPANVLMFVMEPAETNTGSVAINGKIVLSPGGDELLAGQFVAGRSYLLSEETSNFRLRQDVELSGVPAGISAAATAGVAAISAARSAALAAIEPLIADAEAAAASASNTADSLADTLAAIEEGIEGAAEGLVQSDSWTGLDSVIGTREGQPGRVVTDATTTHTDPVTSATVADAGEYAWSESPAGWKWIGETAATKVNSALEVTDNLRNRRTKAFLDVITDPDGFAVEVMDPDGVRHSPDLDTMREVTTALAGRSPRQTLAFETVDLDAEGYALRVFNPDGSLRVAKPPGYLRSQQRTLTGLVSDIALVLIYGQSVATGPDTTAISTLPFTGLKAFAGGAGASGFDFDDPANFASMIDLVESGVETASRGVGESFLQFYNSEAGHAYTDDGRELLILTAAEGGKTTRELSNGGTYFDRLKDAVDAGLAIAAAAGKTISVIPVVYCQGEQETSTLTDPGYRARLIEEGIRLPLQAYAREKLGYPVEVIMLLTQTASHQYYGVSSPLVAEHDLWLCQNDPHYVLVGPMYQFDYGAGSIGSHLASAAELKWLAAMVGRALQRVARGEEYKWLNPLRANAQGARMLIAEYEVPSGSLALDTTNVSDPGKSGFSLYRRDTWASVAISSVTITARNCVRIITSGDLPDATLHLRYAWEGGGTGVNAGRTTGSRGNLRDSSPDTFTISGTPKPLYNWAPIHSFVIR